MVNINLGIKELREDNDYNQQFVANYLMCDQSLYSKYEREIREIPLKYVVSLAELYNVSMDYICGISNSKSRYPQK